MSKPEAWDRRVRVVQVLLSPRIGGAESLVSSLEACWSGTDVQTSTLYLDESVSAPRNRVARITHLAAELRRRRPDVIIAHSAIPNIYARIAAPVGIPVVTVLHSAGDDFKGLTMRVVERLLSLRTAYIVAVSQAQMDRYLQHFRLTKRIAVIPNGIRSDIRSKTKSTAKLATLVTVARVADQKNPTLWTEVIDHLHKDEPNLRFAWWGPVSSDPNIQALVDEFTSKPSTGRFAGPTTDPCAILEDADALFHPADREAHSIGILEAAAAGLPVLCTEGVAATLPSAIVALPFEGGNAESALRSIRELAEGWQSYSSRAIAAAAGVKDAFSIEKCADQYLQVIGVVRRR